MEFKGTKGKLKVVRCGSVMHVTEKIVDSLYLSCEKQEYFLAKIVTNDRSELENKANALLLSKALLLLENAQMQIDSLDLSNEEFYEKYSFNVSELIPKTRQLIKEATEI